MILSNIEFYGTPAGEVIINEIQVISHAKL